MNTRRYPRTCDQAFGPYNRSSQCYFEPMQSEPKMPLSEKVLYALAPICVIVAIIFNNWA